MTHCRLVTLLMYSTHIGPIEFVIEDMLGKLLYGSEIIEKADVLQYGRAEPVVAGSDSHIKRVRSPPSCLDQVHSSGLPRSIYDTL